MLQSSAFKAPLHADDNPILRDFLSVSAKEALSKYASEETAWHNHDLHRREEWRDIRNPLTGRVVRRVLIAQWREEVETWVWLDSPAEHLQVNVTRFEVTGDQVAFRVEAVGKAKGRVTGKIPKVVQGEVKASARVHLVIEGSAKIVDGRFQEVRLPVFDGHLSDLRFNSDVLQAVQGLAEQCANKAIENKRDKIKTKIIEAIERQRL